MSLEPLRFGLIGPTLLVNDQGVMDYDNMVHWSSDWCCFLSHWLNSGTFSCRTSFDRVSSIICVPFSSLWRNLEASLENTFRSPIQISTPFQSNHPLFHV